MNKDNSPKNPQRLKIDIDSASVAMGYVDPDAGIDDFDATIAASLSSVIQMIYNNGNEVAEVTVNFGDGYKVKCAVAILDSEHNSTADQLFAVPPPPPPPPPPPGQ